MTTSPESISFNCTCGQALAVQQDRAGLRVRCPKCSKILTVPSETELAQPIAAEPGSLRGRHCAVCQTAIADGEDACLCPSCRSPYHRECWEEIRGCAIYGCEQMPEQAKSESENGDQGSAWGDVKECPRCHKEIMAAAVKCRFCKTSFPSSVPMTNKEFRDWSRQQKALAPTRRTAISLFVGGLLGFPAPLVLAYGLAWVIKYRRTLHRAGGVHELLAYAGVGLSAIYSLLFLIFALI
jgi:phage FluMu protein Com